MFGLAVALNIANHKPLVLLAVVALGIFAPIPEANFLKWCIFVEFAVFLLAAAIGSKQAMVVCILSIALIVSHIFCIYGYGIKNMSYHYSVKLFEHAQLLVCCVPMKRKAAT